MVPMEIQNTIHPLPSSSIIATCLLLNIPEEQTSFANTPQNLQALMIKTHTRNHAEITCYKCRMQTVTHSQSIFVRK
jgi:hypothetical protein